MINITSFSVEKENKENSEKSEVQTSNVISTGKVNPVKIFGHYHDHTEEVINGDLSEVNNINAIGKIKAEAINTKEGHFEKVDTKDLKTETTQAKQGTFENITAKNIASENLTNKNRLITKSVDTDSAEIKNNLNAGTITTKSITADKANLTNIFGQNLSIDNLTVNKSAHFIELVIDKLKSTEGNVILSPSNAKIIDVEKVNNTTYKAYFLAEKDGKSITNTFQKDDLILCQTFNKAQEGKSNNVSNKFYWVVCSFTSSEKITRSIKGKEYKCHFITLDFNIKDKNTNSTPEIGDNIITLGNRTNLDRQNAILIGSYNNVYLDNEIKAPFISQYQGIKSFELKKYRGNTISQGFNSFVGNFVTSTGKKVSEYIDNFRQPKDGKDGIDGVNGKDGKDGQTVRKNLLSIKNNIDVIKRKSDGIGNKYIGTLDQNVILHSTGRWIFYPLKIDTITEEAKNVTLSFDWRLPNDMKDNTNLPNGQVRLSFEGANRNENKKTNYSITTISKYINIDKEKNYDNWTRQYLTTTINDKSWTINTLFTGEIKNIKLEIGEEPTAYIPHEIDLKGKDGTNGLDGQDGANAVQYNLLPEREDVVIDKFGTIGIFLAYHIQKIEGDTTTIMPSSDKLKIMFTPIYEDGKSYDYTLLNYGELSTYQNERFERGYKTSDNKLRYIKVILFKDDKIACTRVVLCSLLPSATFEITDKIISKVQDTIKENNKQADAISKIEQQANSIESKVQQNTTILNDDHSKITQTINEVSTIKQQANKIESTVQENKNNIEKNKSTISQTAKDIVLKLNNTGINIEDKKITLKGDRVNIEGSLNLYEKNYSGFTIYDKNNNKKLELNAKEITPFSQLEKDEIRDLKYSKILRFQTTYNVTESISIGSLEKNTYLQLSDIKCGISMKMNEMPTTYNNEIKLKINLVNNTNGREVEGQTITLLNVGKYFQLYYNPKFKNYYYFTTTEDGNYSLKITYLGFTDKLIYNTTLFWVFSGKLGIAKNVSSFIGQNGMSLHIGPNKIAYFGDENFLLQNKDIALKIGLNSLKNRTILQKMVENQDGKYFFVPFNSANETYIIDKSEMEGNDGKYYTTLGLSLGHNYFLVSDMYDNSTLYIKLPTSIINTGKDMSTPYQLPIGYTFTIIKGFRNLYKKLVLKAYDGLIYFGNDQANNEYTINKVVNTVIYLGNNNFAIA